MSAATPLVSIVLPTRNRPPLLARALASIQAQTYPLRQVEVCVVNDAGVEVADLVERAAAGLTVRYLRLDCHSGLPTARNAALALASGTVVAYLDDDDEFHPHHLQASIDRLSASGVDAVLAWVESCYEHHGARHRQLDFAYPFDAEFLAVTNAHPIIGLVHRRMPAALFDPSLPLMEDWDALQRLRFERGARFASLPQVTTTYHRSTAGPRLTSSSPIAFDAAYVRITARWQASWAPNPRVAQLQRLVRRHYAAQLQAGTCNDLTTYERFLRSLWSHAQTQRLQAPSRGSAARHRTRR